MNSLSFVLATALAVAASSGAFAADLVGPPIGNNKYRGTISTYDDQDDFTGMLLRGDVLTVALSVPKTGGPPIKPAMSLIDPAGNARTANFVVSKGGAILLKNFVVDTTGLWAVRVEALGGTSGDYLLTFKVKTTPKVTYRAQSLGNDQPIARGYEFPGVTGAVLDAKLTYSARGLPVGLRNLFDPSGAEVLDWAGRPALQSAKVRGRTITLKNVELSEGTGAYHLWTNVQNGSGQFDLTIALRCPDRPVSGKLRVVPVNEPTLDVLPSERIAKAGDTVRFTGTHFSTGVVPAVRFGGAFATQVTVGAGGTTIDVVVPPRSGAALVPVYVINPDGQGTSRERHFAYLPAPAVTDLVDALTGDPVRTSPAPGGRTVRLVGDSFETNHTVRIGGTLVTAPKFLSATDIRFVLPPLPDGYRTLTVTDSFGRTGPSSVSVRYKTAPAFASAPYSPTAAKANVAATVTLRGSGFEPADQVFVNGHVVPSTWTSATARSVDLPALPAGGYVFRLVDEIGTVVDGPAYPVKSAPVISSVTVVSGPVLRTDCIPLAGGSTIRVDGSNFDAGDSVTFGGVKVTSFATSTATRKEFVAPAGSAGRVSVTILDGADQSVTAKDVVRYVGFLDATAARLPAPSSDDDLSALRGAVADLDGDGLEDDLVLVSPIGDSPGARAAQTRVLFGDTSGGLVDRTSDVFPAARSDGMGIDAWDATCLAIGDLDGRGGPDVLIAGQVGWSGGYQQVRTFMNDGSGGFALDEGFAPADRSASYVYGDYSWVYYGYWGNYYYSNRYSIYGSLQQKGVPTAVAVGDLDLDGTIDVVLGTDDSQSRSVYLDPSYIDFTTSPPAIRRVSWVSWQQYFPGTRVLLNGGSLVDVSPESLPSAGTSNDTKNCPAALHSRDLAVADLDGDGLLDLVVTWDDPTTVSAFGLATLKSGGASLDVARTATRVLLNDPTSPGRFSDVTDSWMPKSSSPEHWQANRLTLADLDGDGDPDLVLVLSKGLDAWTGSETHDLRALRVLRNEGSTFTDVTSSAVPAVDKATQDDWRGDAVAVRDVNGDGFIDVLVSTNSQLTGPPGTTARRLRVLFGTAAGTIGLRRAAEFQESVQIDSGEADDLLFVGDGAGSDTPVLLLLGESKPKASPSGGTTRAQEWKQ